MWQVGGRVSSKPWQSAGNAAYRFARSRPPPPRPFKPSVSSERVVVHDAKPVEVTPPKDKTPLFSRLWPFSRTRAEPSKNEPRDPARGIEAAQRVVREGQLDARYKDAARRVTALICALPIAIYLSYELWRRRFLGVERKPLPPPKARKQEEENAVLRDQDAEYSKVWEDETIRPDK